MAIIMAIIKTAMPGIPVIFSTVCHNKGGKMHRSYRFRRGAKVDQLNDSVDHGIAKGNKSIDTPSCHTRHGQIG